MRAIDKTVKRFVTSVREAVPHAKVNVQRSVSAHGRSTYVYIMLEKRWRPIKVRISDHAVGMRRALYGDENLFIHHLAKPASWAVWVSQLAKGEHHGHADNASDAGNGSPSLFGLDEASRAPAT